MAAIVSQQREVIRHAFTISQEADDDNNNNDAAVPDKKRVGPVSKQSQGQEQQQQI